MVLRDLPLFHNPHSRGGSKRLYSEAEKRGALTDLADLGRLPAGGSAGLDAFLIALIILAAGF